MSTEFAPPTPPPVGPQKQGMGCLGKGCIFFLAVLILIFGAIGFGAFTMYHQIYAFTSDKAVEVPIYDTTKEHGIEVGKRYTDFTDLVNQGKPATIRLTDEDLNTLIAQDPVLKDARGKVFFKIHDGRMDVQTSVPMGDTPFFKGRYLNATIAIKIFIESGIVSIEPEEITANDKKMSPQFLKALQGLRWTESLRKVEGTGQVLDRIKKLQVEDNVLVVETK